MKASDAIRNSLSQCTDRRELEVASYCIIEFCSAMGMSDAEIIEACRYAGGNSVMEDDILDEIISNLEQ